jgi:hypothetical protein
MGGRSIIDPDGFPYTAKQTAALQMVTPRSEGGPTENDPSPNSENDRDKERDGMNDSEKKKIVEQADKENFDKLEKEVREQLDHHFLDEVPGLGPATLENLCLFIWRALKPSLPGLSAVQVERHSIGDKCLYRP